MRQLSIHRPNAKIRGIERRLRSLDRWAVQLEQVIPAYKDQRYWNYKIPVLDRLVSPPTTTHEIQKRAIQSLIKGAVALSRNELANELPYYKVAVLLVLPRMFHSEVTAFYDPDYYESFIHSEKLLPMTGAPSNIFNITIPDGFIETGTLVEWEDEFEPGIIEKFSEIRWTIGQIN